MEENKEIIESTEEVKESVEADASTETITEGVVAENTDSENAGSTETVSEMGTTESQERTSMSELKEALAEEISISEAKATAPEPLTKSSESEATPSELEADVVSEDIKNAENAKNGVNIRHLKDDIDESEGARKTVFKKPTKDNKALKCADIEMLVDESGKFDDSMTFADRVMLIRDWIMEHSKLVMPLVLVVCIILTIVIALNASRREHLEKVASNVAAENAQNSESSVDADISIISTPDISLEENAYPEINQLVKKYYDAQADGDTDTVSSLNTYLNDIELLRIKQLSNYIEQYEDINVYTKPGLADNTFVAYVCANVKFYDNETTLPGMQTYYISADDTGVYSITDGTYDDSIYEYIKTLTIQDDVVDLNNKIVVEYNDIIENSAIMADYLVYIKGMINEEVGEMLAEEESPAETTVLDEGTATTTTQPVATIVSMVRAKERVNIRKSDSKEADKVGAASAGEEFKLLEKKDNGWTKIEYNGAEAYINSDYVEDVNAVNVELTDAGTETSPEATTSANPKATKTPEASASPSPSPSPKATNEAMSGKIKVNASGVRVRSGAGTDTTVLGTVYVGSTFDATGKEGDWVQINYNGKTGYIKSDFVEKID